MVYSALSSSSVTSQFTRRKKIHINSSADGELVNYQVELTISYEPGMQTDFDDIRFSETDGSHISYWIESKTDSSTATVWINTDVPSSGGKDVYMYYGSSGLTAGTSGASVFGLFDCFDNGTLVDDGIVSDFGSWYNNRASDIVGNYAYVTETNGLHVVDISTITSPSVVGYVALGTQTLDVEVDGNYAYVSVLISNKLSVVDISTPASPSETGSVTDATKLNQVHGIAKVGDYVYCCAYASGGSTGHFTIVDVSTPSTPTIRGCVVNDTNNYIKGSHDVQVIGDYAYLIASDHHVDTDGRLTIINVADKDSPYVVSSITGSEFHRSADIQIKGDYAFFGQWGYPHSDPEHRYFRVVDISDVDNPVLVGGLAGYNMYIGYIYGDLVYCADSRFDTITVIDISNPLLPTFVKQYIIPGSTAVLHVSLTDNGSYGVIARYNSAGADKFYIIDTSITPTADWTTIQSETGDTVSATTNKLVMTKGSTSGYLQVETETLKHPLKQYFEFMVEYSTGKRCNMILNGDNSNPLSGAIYLAFDTSGVRYYDTTMHTICTMDVDTEYKISVVPDVSTDTFDIYVYKDGVEVSYSGAHTGLDFRNNATYINKCVPNMYTATNDAGIFDCFRTRKYTANEPTTSIGTEQHQRRIPVFM